MKISESSAKRGNVYFRGKEFVRAAACWMLMAQLAGLPYAQAGGDKSAAKPAPAAALSDPVLKAMQDEIKRASAELGKTEQPPYYLSYTVYDQDFVVLIAPYRTLLPNARLQTPSPHVNI